MTLTVLIITPGSFLCFPALSWGLSKTHDANMSQLLLRLAVCLTASSAQRRLIIQGTELCSTCRMPRHPTPCLTATTRHHGVPNTSRVHPSVGWTGLLNTGVSGWLGRRVWEVWPARLSCDWWNLGIGPGTERLFRDNSTSKGLQKETSGLLV